MTAPAVELDGITKRYGDVVANDSAGFSALRGEVHAIVGENGAGKTTLMRVLGGLTRPDGGEVRIDGGPVRFRSAADAARAGVGMVHQHFTLVAVFTVLENLALAPGAGSGGGTAAIRAGLLSLSERLGFPVDPDARVADLTVGERQRVEILRVLSLGTRILILDEPTAVLTPGEARQLFAVLRRLSADGATVLFITHRLPEVLAASDRVTVMRRGRTVATVGTGETSEAELARLMVGREIAWGARAPREAPPGEERLVVAGLEADGDRGVPALRGVGLSVRSGEILGVAGVMGNGQRELLEAIQGLRTPTAGSIRLGDRDLAGLTVRRRMSLGISLVPEDRLDQGLVLALPAGENIALGLPRDDRVFGRVLYRKGELRRRAAEEMGALDVRPLDPDAGADAFSGGNQQKVLLARALAGSPRVLLLAEPTRGLDVGAIERVHGAIREARDGGAAVLLVSSDLAELLALADRLIVLSRGRVAGEVTPGETTEEELGLMMAGTTP